MLYRLVSWANRSSFALVVYKANREHLLESGGRPVCRTVPHQSLDDLILSLSLSVLCFFIFWIFDRLGSVFQTRVLFVRARSWWLWGHLLFTWDFVFLQFLFLYIFFKVGEVVFNLYFFKFFWPSLFWVCIFDPNYFSLSLSHTHKNTNRCLLWWLHSITNGYLYLSLCLTLLSLFTFLSFLFCCLWLCLIKISGSSTITTTISTKYQKLGYLACGLGTLAWGVYHDEIGYVFGVHVIPPYELYCL